MSNGLSVDVVMSYIFLFRNGEANIEMSNAGIKCITYFHKKVNFTAGYNNISVFFCLIVTISGYL